MNKPKILLFFPNTANEGVMPLAIGILSTIAKQNGYDVRYFETSFYQKRLTAGEERQLTGEFKPVDRQNVLQLLPYESMLKDLIAIIRSYQPDIIAVTANSLEYDLFCDLIKEVDFKREKPFIIVGGVHATISPREVISNEKVDALCIGEGEEAWQEFLLNFKSGQDINNMKNLWVKTGSIIKENPIRSLLSREKLWEIEIDDSYFDDRHSFKPFDGIMYKRGLIEMSRGCPYSCAYCVNSTFKSIFHGHGKFFRVRPLDSLMERARMLIRRGCEMLQLQDECFFSIPYDYLEKFCHWYSREVRLPLLLQTRPESVTEEKLKFVSDMGVVVQISCGVESGSERILNDICKRRTTLTQIKDAFRLIHKHKLRSNAYTMIGFPTETRDEVFQTIYLIREIKPDISVMSVFYPFAGTPLRDYCIEKGFIRGDERAKTFTDLTILKNQPMSPQEIKDLRRVYRLYTKLPEKYFSKIELCEKDFEGHKSLFNELVSLSWTL